MEDPSPLPSIALESAEPKVARGGRSVVTVCSVIGLLLLWVLVYLFVVLPTAKNTKYRSRTKADISAIETAIIRYSMLNSGDIPASLEELAKIGPKVKRQLIKPSTIRDPWGNDYLLRRPGKHNSTGYDIFSKGPDQLEGTADDIGNWDS